MAEDFNMEDNYYIPNPDEFRNGFIFEGKFNDGTWKEITLNLEDAALFTNLRHEIWSIEHGFVRVKMLDADDFEAEGFTFVSRHFLPSPHDRDWHTFRNESIMVEVDINPKAFPFVLKITDIDKILYTGNFKIKIKNRSELRDLLSKINFKEQ